MITASTIAGPRGAAGATASQTGLAGGSGLDFSAMMGGVLTDAAVPPVATGVTAASVGDVVLGAVPVDAATADLSASLPMPVVPVMAEAISVPRAASAAPQEMPATTASLTVSLPAGPAPVPEFTPVIVTGQAVPPVPMAQVATCMVEIEAGGRRRHAAEREEDAPAGEDEAIVAETDPVVVADASAATPAPVLSVMPLPSAAVAAWRAVSRSDANDGDAAAAAAAKSATAISADPKPGTVAATISPVVQGASTRFADVVPDRPVDIGTDPAMAARAANRPVAVTVGPSAVPTRSDAVVPDATVMPVVQASASAQPVAVTVPVVNQTPASSQPAVAQTGQAMPPAMAMLQDISTLLAEPAAAAQPVSAAPMPTIPTVVAQPAPVVLPASSPVPQAVAVQAQSAMPAVMTAAESPRQGRRREGASGAVEAARPSEGIVPVSESATAPAPTLLSMPTSGTASAPTAGSGSGPAAIPADAALGFHVDAARHGQELDQVTRDIAATGQAGAPLSFKLDSHRLGAVAVELTQQVAGLHVRLESDDATTRTILADQQQQLVTDARVAGVRIAETSVEAPRRDDATSGQGGGMTRHDSPSAQGQNAQSQSGQAGGQANGQRGQGQPSQTAPGWSRATREGQARAGQPAVTPRELYA